MSYKIISIPTKRGKADISLCPSGWEYENVVRWPPKMLNTLQMDPHSQPENDWKQYKCVVKRSNIRSYEEAVDWESMYENVDTDSEQSLNAEQYQPVVKTKAIKKPHTITNSNIQSFNNLFASVRDENEVTPINTTPVVLQRQPDICSPRTIIPQSTTTSTPSSAIQQTVPDKALDITNTPIIVANTADDLSSLIFPSAWDSEAFNAIKNDIFQFKEQVKKELKVIQERQVANDARVATATDKVLATLDEIKTLIKDISSSQNVVGVDAQAVSGQHLDDEHTAAESFLTKYPLPILELEELKRFNAELHSNRYFYDFWVEHFGNLFGNDGKHKKGEAVGKKISEMIISKSLMPEISYTGVSRTAGVKCKYALQKLESLLDLITTATKNADDRWDAATTVELFSNKLLKHSRKRQLAHQLKIQRMGKKPQKMPVVNQDEVNDVDDSTDAPAELVVENSTEAPAELAVENSTEAPAELAVENSTEASAELVVDRTADLMTHEVEQLRNEKP